MPPRVSARQRGSRLKCFTANPVPALSASTRCQTPQRSEDERDEEAGASHVVAIGLAELTDRSHLFSFCCGDESHGRYADQHQGRWSNRFEERAPRKEEKRGIERVTDVAVGTSRDEVGSREVS